MVPVIQGAIALPQADAIPDCCLVTPAFSDVAMLMILSSIDIHVHPPFRTLHLALVHFPGTMVPARSRLCRERGISFCMFIICSPPGML